MLYRINPCWWGLAAILGLRLLVMVWLPLADTSEPRYAEVARLMATSGDWITPWFAPDIPFWGKPPLAFWTEALSFKLFGINEFAVRFPSWLATLGTLALIHTYACHYFGDRIAKYSLLIYSTCALTYIASGAVLTDPFLALATTGAMVSFTMAAREPRWYWRYGFFIALAVGLLAKGPLVLVLVFGAIVPWLVWHKSARRSAKKLPWFSGLALTFALSLPWYILAELKTPGFLNYFLAGEHFLRFVDSGWTGDLYGKAHERTKGTIWIYAIQASFPWGVAALYLLLRRMANPLHRMNFTQVWQDPDRSYLLSWTLFPLIFFTFAGNILWTYVLPALAGFCILMAMATVEDSDKARIRQRFPFVIAGIIPLVLAAFTLMVIIQPQRLASEKSLIDYAIQHMRPGENLAFLETRPFSARYYSHGQAKLISRDKLATTIRKETLYLAVRKKDFEDVARMLNAPLPTLYESRRYLLTVVPSDIPGFPTPDLTETLAKGKNIAVNNND